MKIVTSEEQTGTVEIEGEEYAVVRERGVRVETTARCGRCGAERSGLIGLARHIVGRHTRVGRFLRRVRGGR